MTRRPWKSTNEVAAGVRPAAHINVALRIKSTETVRTTRDGEPRMASTFSQLLSFKASCDTCYRFVHSVPARLIVAVKLRSLVSYQAFMSVELLHTLYSVTKLVSAFAGPGIPEVIPS